MTTNTHTLARACTPSLANNAVPYGVVRCNIAHTHTHTPNAITNYFHSVTKYKMKNQQQDCKRKKKEKKKKKTAKFFGLRMHRSQLKEMNERKTEKKMANIRCYVCILQQCVNDLVVGVDHLGEMRKREKKMQLSIEI